MQRRVLHCADLHLGLLRYGATQGTQDAMLDRLAGAAREHAVDVVVIAGDVFHTRRPESAALHSFARFVKNVTGFAELLITPGNHDGPGEVDDTLLKPAGWMAELDVARVHAVPGMARVPVANIAFYVLPYIHRRGSLASRTEQALVDLAGMGKHEMKVLVAHQTVAGSRLSADILMQIGWDLTLQQEWLGPFDAALLGHIHHQQFLSPFVAYPGAPERFDFGDEAQDKGFLLWDFADGGPVKVMSLSSGARRMLTITTGPVPASGWLQPVQPGDVVRVLVEGERMVGTQRTTHERDLREAVIATGAGWVRIDYLVTKSHPDRVRARLDPNVEALAALRQWCEVNGIEYDPLEPVAKAIVTRAS